MNASARAREVLFASPEATMNTTGVGIWDGRAGGLTYRLKNVVSLTVPAAITRAKAAGELLSDRCLRHAGGGGLH
jgi:hypothetical protein